MSNTLSQATNLKHIMSHVMSDVTDDLMVEENKSAQVVDMSSQDFLFNLLKTTSSERKTSAREAHIQNQAMKAIEYQNRVAAEHQQKLDEQPKQNVQQPLNTLMVDPATGEEHHDAELYNRAAFQIERAMISRYLNRFIKYAPFLLSQLKTWTGMSDIPDFSTPTEQKNLTTMFEQSFTIMYGLFYNQTLSFMLFFTWFITLVFPLEVSRMSVLMGYGIILLLTTLRTHGLVFPDKIVGFFFEWANPEQNQSYYSKIVWFLRPCWRLLTIRRTIQKETDIGITLAYFTPAMTLTTLSWVSLSSTNTNLFWMVQPLLIAMMMIKPRFYTNHINCVWITSVMSLMIGDIAWFTCLFYFHFFSISRSDLTNMVGNLLWFVAPTCMIGVMISCLYWVSELFVFNAGYYFAVQTMMIFCGWIPALWFGILFNVDVKTELTQLHRVFILVTYALSIPMYAYKMTIFLHWILMLNLIYSCARQVINFRNAERINNERIKQIVKNM